MVDQLPSREIPDETASGRSEVLAKEVDMDAGKAVEEDVTTTAPKSKQPKPEDKELRNNNSEAATETTESDSDPMSAEFGDFVSAPALQTKPDSELSAFENLTINPPETENTTTTTTTTATDKKRPFTPIKDATLKPLVASPPPPAPPPKDVPPKDFLPKDRIYLDQPPVTPVPSRPTSPLPGLNTNFGGGSSTSKSQPPSDDENDGTQSVIHDLFEKSHRASIGGEQLQRIPSTASSIGSPLTLHPPRSSSLSAPSTNEPDVATLQLKVETRISPASSPNPALSPISPTSPAVNTAKPTPHRPPPPDEDLPFDFHRFLAQLRHRSADPVAKFLRSFLNEFAKKQWMVHEQVKIIRDFLTFIYGKMDMCEVWREVGDVEMDNAMEGMEKLVMNRLYTQTFSPAIPLHDGKGRVDERFPGRRGQHQEDVERDSILSQKVRIYSWIREEHLDIGDTVSGEGGRRFLELAVKEMLKIGSYRAPRDKVICVLNCCKVIFGLLRHSKSEESADKFVPLLIYVVLRANPEHLVSNVQYILRFRNPDKLTGEAGYYLSSLMGAIQFIENLDRSSLTISAEEFERNVEAAVAQIAERPPPPSPPPPPPKSADPDSSGSEEKVAVAGLLRSLQRPLSTIGRIFNDESGPAVIPRLSPNPSEGDPVLTAVGGRGGTRRYAEEAAARQASAEAEEAARIGRMEYEHVVETLQRMFPSLDREVICDVVNMKEGRVGAAVDACLALCTS